jgi:ketosteroid isomerase-like protein
MNIPEAGEVLVSGDLAMEVGSYSVTDESGATVDTGEYIDVFQTRDDEWRHVRDTWNSDGQAAAE